MNIKLNVKKDTFRKYLIELGYNYNIKQYDDFINKMGNVIKKEISKAIKENKLHIVINKMFIGSPELIILEDIRYIENLNPKYIKEIIDDGIFDLYLIEEEIKIKDNIKEAVYYYNKINKLSNEARQMFIRSDDFENLFKKNSSIYKNIKKYNNYNIKDVSNAKELENKIKEKIAKEMLYSHIFFQNKIKDVKNNRELEIKIKEVVEKYIKNNINLNKNIELMYLKVINIKRDEKINENIENKLINIAKEDRKEVISLLHNFYLEKFSSNKLDIIDALSIFLKENLNVMRTMVNRGDIFNIIKYIDKYSYLYEMKNEILNKDNIIEFNVVFIMNDEEIILNKNEFID